MSKTTVVEKSGGGEASEDDLKPLVDLYERHGGNLDASKPTGICE